MEEPPAPLRKVSPAQVGVKADIANISCWQDCEHSNGFAFFHSPLLQAGGLPGDLVVDREVTEVPLVRLWLRSSSCWDDGTLHGRSDLGQSKAA